MALEPITRQEQLLNAIATGDAVNINPITREEMFLAKAGGQDVQTPAPITRKEMFLQKIAENGGGGTGEGDTGWVVCELEAISTSITIGNLRGLRLRCPNVASIPIGAFFNHDIFLSIDLPAATSIGERAFAGCHSLTSVDLPVTTRIWDGAFDNCNALTALILRTTETVCVAELSAFIGTPMMTGQGYIYVPASMYEDYRAGYEATLDTVMPGFFDILFRKIEDYPEICG